MKRTRLEDRVLPNYTRGEERFNMISHIVGGAIGVAGMVLGIITAVYHQSGYSLAGAIVFGVSMLFMYSMSSIYHGLPNGMGKRVMQVLDHCSVYVLIAGTYTPVLLAAMRPVDPVGSWVLFGIVWSLAITAIVFTAIDLNRWSRLSMTLYVAIGWTIVVRLPVLIRAVGLPGFLLILAGGLFYTTGSVLYHKGKTRRYMHCVFHVFVVFGTVCHILAVLLYVL